MTSPLGTEKKITFFYSAATGCSRKERRLAGGRTAIRTEIGRKYQSAASKGSRKAKVRTDRKENAG